MPGLPTVLSDANIWGTELNNYLSVGHTPGVAGAGGGYHQHIFDVTEYGAIPGTDCTTAIQAAIQAAQNAGGGKVFIRPSSLGSYNISSTLVINSDNIEIEGGGWGAQLFWTGAASGTMLQVQGPGGAGNFRYGFRIANLFLNGNNIAGLNGLDIVSTYGAIVDHLRMRFITGINVHWDGISGAFGAYNYMRHNHITDGGATAVGIQTDSSEWLTIHGGHLGFFNGGTTTAIKLQNLNCIISGVGFDHNDTCINVSFAGRCVIEGCQFDRGFVRFIYLQSASHCTVKGNFFGVFSGSQTSPNDIIRCDGNNNDKNVVIGNTVQVQSLWTNFVNEPAGTLGQNLYVGNDTGGLPIVVQSGMGIARGNSEYNPVASLATPAAPTTSNAGSGGTVLAGTYQMIVTLVSASGETIGSASSPQTTAGSTSTLTVNSPPRAGNASGWYAYISAAGGSAASSTRQQAIAAPSAPAATGNTGTGSAFTGAQTVNVAISYVTVGGETTVSGNTLVTINATGNNVVVTLPSFPAGVFAANVYASTASGGSTLNKVQALGVTSQSSGGTVTITGFPATGVVVPASNTSGVPTAFGTNFTITAPPTAVGIVAPTSNTTTGVTTPAVPSSGVALRNTTGVDVIIFLTGGTFTGNHQIGGLSIGNSTATVLYVAAGETVTLTYSAAPTWVWKGQ